MSFLVAVSAAKSAAWGRSNYENTITILKGVISWTYLDDYDYG